LQFLHQPTEDRKLHTCCGKQNVCNHAPFPFCWWGRVFWWMLHVDCFNIYQTAFARTETSKERLWDPCCVGKTFSTPMFYLIGFDW
jgi:hypothetical protein